MRVVTLVILLLAGIAFVLWRIERRSPEIGQCEDDGCHCRGGARCGR